MSELQTNLAELVKHDVIMRGELNIAEASAEQAELEKTRLQEMVLKLNQVRTVAFVDPSPRDVRDLCGKPVPVSAFR